MGDATLLRARIEGGQDYVDAVCFELLRGEEYERARGLTRGLLLAAVLAGAAPGIAIARATDRRHDGRVAGFVEPVLDAPDSENGEEDAVPEA